MLARTKIAFLGAVTAASFFALHAGAQNNPPAPAPSAPPAQAQPQSEPTQSGSEQPGSRQPGSGQTGEPAAAPRNDRFGEQDWDRRGRGMGRGMGPGQMRQGNRAQMSDADRQAFFEARLASIKAGLMLDEAQLRLWPPIENAVREIVKQRREWRERLAKDGRPANPVDRMKRMGEMQTARGAALTKYADVLRPLYDTLSDEQKRRLRVLTRQGRFGMMQGGARGQGRGMYRHHREGMNRNFERDPNRSFREGRGEGRGQYHQRWREHHGQGQQGGRWRDEGQGQRQQREFGQGRRWQQDMPGEGFATPDNFENGGRL